MSDATRVPQFPLRASKPGLDGDIDPIHPSDPAPFETEEVSDSDAVSSVEVSDSDAEATKKHDGPRHSTKTKD